MYRFVVRTRDRSTFVGSAVLFDVEFRNRSAEVGYALAKGQWNRGYATEAVGRLVRWAFDSLHLRRLDATVFAANVPSRQVLRKVGFRREGRRREASRLGNVWVDDLHYGLLRDEFRSR